MQKTVCELFAGVGGFRVGLEKASKDWKTVWANQWEPSKKSQHAFECYRTHFENEGGVNENSNTDIAKVSANDIPDHNLLVGGFPCQDYSVASTGAKGIQGKKGVLWWEIERIVKEKQASFILLENVDRLIKSPSTQRGRDFAVMLACLNKLNYTVEWRVINAAEYGLQQRRRRVFIFASKNSTNYNKTINKDMKKHLMATGFFATEFPVQHADKDGQTIELSEDLLKVSQEFKFKFENTGIMRNGEIYSIHTTPDDSNIDEAISLGDLLVEDANEKFYISANDMEKWTYMKGAKAIERTSKTGHKYTFREGAIAFPDPLDKPARTMLTSESSKNRSTHVVLDPLTKKLRKLTPIECERINGFPDDWTNTGMTESFRYFCMGNALVVNLVEIIAKKLEKIFENEN